jgi:adenylosuccinate lyase
MDTRYLHPQVAALWDRPWTYAAWWRIEKAVAVAQIAEDVIDKHEAGPIANDRLTPSFTHPAILLELANLERTTKHDVAAFVKWTRQWYGGRTARWVHYGLTSSDLVDTAQGLRFKAMSDTVRAACMALLAQTERWEADATIVPGRTHGQPAEPTTIGVRADHWGALLEPAIGHLLRDTRKLATAKLSGPVGTYAHNPPSVEGRVAIEFGLSVQTGASQISPRGNLARWANSAAEMVQACAKVAMDFRLMNLLDEANEPKEDGQVGSSAMPHKTNPIRAEQITGLARLAAGYASMLQALDLWLERDISHSCVERVAVPDLWHVVLHAIDQTTQLLARVQLMDRIIKIHLEDRANELYSCSATLAGIRDGMEADEARAFAEEAQIESYDLLGDIRKDFLGNYPRKQPINERP